MAMKFRCVSTAQHNTPTDRPKRVGDIRQILWRCLRWRHGKTVKCNDKILMILDIQGTVIEESPSFCRSVENCRSLWRLNSGAWAPLDRTHQHTDRHNKPTHKRLHQGALRSHLAPPLSVADVILNFSRVRTCVPIFVSFRPRSGPLNCNQRGRRKNNP